jgi:hypothetical protein
MFNEKSRSITLGFLPCSSVLDLDVCSLSPLPISLAIQGTALQPQIQDVYPLGKHVWAALNSPIPC